MQVRRIGINNLWNNAHDFLNSCTKHIYMAPEISRKSLPFQLSPPILTMLTHFSINTSASGN